MATGDKTKDAPVEGEIVSKEEQADAKAKAKAAAKDAPKSVLTQQDKREINKAVLTQETSVMNPVEYEQMRKMANDMWVAGALPESYKNAEQVFMAIQLGKQMGFSAHEAVLNGYYVSGRYNVYGKALPSALRRAGWRWTFKEKVNECTVELKHVTSKEEITDTFTFEDAVSSGFTRDRSNNLKFGWKEGANRKRKLRYGVIAQVVNTYLPEVLGGVADVAEYSSDYVETSVIQDDNNQSVNVKQNAINDQVKNFKPASLENTKPKPVDVE